MSKATIDELGSLHGLLAEHFKDLLKNGVVEKDKDGEEYTRKVTAAELNTIRQFLKDNGVEALAVPGSPLAGLVDSLPFPAVGEVAFSSTKLN